jgi:hypothetical protein
VITNLSDHKFIFSPAFNDRSGVPLMNRMHLRDERPEMSVFSLHAYQWPGVDRTGEDIGIDRNGRAFNQQEY